MSARLTTDPDRDTVTFEVRLKGPVFRLILGVASAVIHPVLFGIVLFGVAETLDWWRAWVFLAVWSVNVFVVCLVVSNDLLIQRMWPWRNGQRIELADVLLGLVMVPVAIGWFVLIPLDAFHLELTSKPPVLVSTAGLVLIVVGWLMMTLALRQNPFASPLVHVQDSREQTVVDTGVYGIVRHPMYAGAVGLMIGLPLWLESYAAALLSIVLIVGLAVRIRIEERLLRRELAGYDAYTNRVRHRLIPFVW